MKWNYNMLLCLSILLTVTVPSFSNGLIVGSPNQNIRFNLKLVPKSNGLNGVFYSVTYKQKEVIEESSLGLKLKQTEITEFKTFKVISQESRDTSWIPLYGERSNIIDRYNSAEIQLVSRSGKVLNLEVRAYNEGVAFRYYFPTKNSFDSFDLLEEKTTFKLPGEVKVWFSNYEQGHYVQKAISESLDNAVMPLTLDYDGEYYASIAEAANISYGKTVLNKLPDEKNTLLTSIYSPIQENAPYATPWRVILLGDSPGVLLENNFLIENLNESCAIDSTNWIKPGKVFRSMDISTQGAKASIDVAKNLKFKYILLDNGWYGNEFDPASDAKTPTLDKLKFPDSELDLMDVIQYGKKNGIGIILYVNRRALEQQLDEILPLYKSWGIAGVKYGYVNVGSQHWTSWLHDAVKLAAKYQLLVDIHDNYRPTGFSRTYPNLLTQEGVLGNEAMPDATHNTVLPFTRYIAGAADYTIAYYRRKEFGGFGKNNRYIKTTPAHQLALSVVYYSPLQHIFWYDTPKDFQGEPEIEFFANVPVVWDETKVVKGEIGKYACVARRNKREWFVGGITNNDPRDLKFTCNFLKPGKDYMAKIYTDGDDSTKTRTKVKIEEVSINSESKLNFNLKAGGGFAIHIYSIANTNKK
jgi:alpha-glucosidase